ncbi:MAG: hypothetical protein WC222_05500 [Parachlamydiales bacterium]|jgi:hypothetical protein
MFENTKFFGFTLKQKKQQHDENTPNYIEDDLFEIKPMAKK